MPRWRLATTLDLARIEELSLGVEFEQGVHNWQLYFETSPDTFYVLESEDYGQVVGYLSRNHIGGGVMLNHHIVMLPEFRRRCAVQGLLRQLRQQWPGPVVSNVNAIGLTLLQSYLEHNRIFYGPRFIGYYGFLPDVFPSHLLNGSSSCKN
ncbi:unnamed protein product, partial [Soboliphyme baturini]|uniref:N-acetyltransferase domain-containing protein n=1 Tax=Soboliphyme baturini TaxID=241478 RepID=A0A183J7E7_9BILA